MERREEVHTVDHSSWGRGLAPRPGMRATVFSVPHSRLFFERLEFCLLCLRPPLSPPRRDPISASSKRLERKSARNLTKGWSMCRSARTQRARTQSELECGPVPPHRRVRTTWPFKAIQSAMGLSSVSSPRARCGSVDSFRFEASSSRYRSSRVVAKIYRIVIDFLRILVRWLSSPKYGPAREEGAR